MGVASVEGWRKKMKTGKDFNILTPSPRHNKMYSAFTDFEVC